MSFVTRTDNYSHTRKGTQNIDMNQRGILVVSGDRQQQNIQKTINITKQHNMTYTSHKKTYLCNMYLYDIVYKQDLTNHAS